ncbi:NADH-FMN oxidoreductase RutF, flavin reductase (DIM6/NTAB) family [Tranquillimonas rosea]|uniref:NADH-FMN oxidoreductase RutF, flavin reductase (DIM6/NTAB) family n=1 Tax=Tranquillimonas rosea TaxID=641238 RepID=A0A1H9WL68_9RHOB|nr:flavin reductase family protein [Tranquillimonas rosea]SES34203.1 NADH-FMN oxidoreductase RutF, flavin reductase (DIM6/NTAB) family [Tranquillimonas rosea]
MSHHALRFDEMTPRDRYKVLIGTVVPRPIAWVTTVSPEGRVNAAPYSFFNVLSHDPAILALGVENKPDMVYKDTAENIRRTDVFTVNIVDRANLEAMAVTAASFPPEVDELSVAGLTAVPGDRVASPRIAESPAAFECRRYVGIEIGLSREIILGEVLMAHVREDVIDTDTYYSDATRLDAIGRMGGNGYAGTQDCFDHVTPKAEDLDWPGK